MLKRQRFHSPRRRPARGEQQAGGRAGDALPPGGPALLSAAGARRGAGAKHAACCDNVTSNRSTVDKYLKFNSGSLTAPPNLTAKSSPNSARCCRLRYTSSLG